jgi:aspartate 1-decarboxylase
LNKLNGEIMQRIMLKSKLHRARVTESLLFYEGSLAIDEDLMEAADILPYEKISVFNINNGERFETYAIPGKRGSGEFCLNGAAARKGMVGDEIIVVTFCVVNEDEINQYEPTIVLLDGTNKIKISK